MGIADKLSVPDEWHRRRLRARRERPRHGSAAEERDELPPLHSIARRRGRAACGSRPLLCGGLRRRLPRDEFPAVRRFCPGVEEHELQAAPSAPRDSPNETLWKVSPSSAETSSLRLDVGG